MAWSTPPTFSNNEVLSATKLNQLSDCVNWLNGVGAQPAPMMLSAPNGSNWYYCPRHTHRYLQVRYYANGGDDIAVKYNGGNIFHDGAPDDGENWMLHNGTTVMDLDSVSGFVAYGQPYVLNIVIAGGTMYVRLVTETSTSAVT